MIIDFKISSDHEVRNQPKCIGVKGDHLTNILRVTFCNCAVKFTSAVVHFTLPNGEKVKTDKLALNDDQTLDYPMPYDIYENSGNISISVEGTDADGRTFSSKPKEYEICEDIDGKTIIVNRIAKLESRIAELEYNELMVFGTEGLAYSGGICNGIGTATDTDIVIGAISKDYTKTTHIAAKAFYNNQNLTSVIIGDTVTHFVGYSFYACKNLISATIGNGVISLGWYAFMGCINLKDVTIGKSVTKIRECAFCQCYSLTQITIPNSVTQIDTQAFMNCTSLEQITIKGSVTSIATSAFFGCANLKDIYVPWAEGAVTGAPWGATNATIHYNSEV